jgi:hypothetical protein
MHFRILIFFIIFFTSCVPDFQLKDIEPYYIFHDNSSKVWLINHLYKNKVDEVPLSVEFKKIIVFHSDRDCYVYNVNNIIEGAGRKASFFLDIKNKKLSIEFNNENWNFTIEKYDEEKIVLNSIDSKSGDYKMELIAFPKI